MVEFNCGDYRGLAGREGYPLQVPEKWNGKDT